MRSRRQERAERQGVLRRPFPWSLFAATGFVLAAGIARTVLTGELFWLQLGLAGALGLLVGWAAMLAVRARRRARGGS